MAGATASLSLLLLLTSLSAGFGLNLVLWLPAEDAFTPLIGAWMVGSLVLSSAVGGYLTGRLREHFADSHDDGTPWRDTASGLLVWATSSVASLVLILVETGARPGDPTAMMATPVEVDPMALERVANISGAVALCLGVGMVLSALAAAVASAVGGAHRDGLYGRRDI